jgi:dTDP-4-dehydrorhamnose reductase
MAAMRLLITGLNGTLGPKVAACARCRGWEVLGWDRRAVDPDDGAAASAFVQALRLDAIVHLALGSEAWAARLAAFAAGRMPFVFSSTAMVFHQEPDGPHAPGAPRNAQDDYGRYKQRCEDAVLAHNAAAAVVRIGWQIDADGRGNNMLAALDQWQARDGCVRASRLWRPACSFMDDTAQALLALLDAPAGGFVHLDSNAADGWTFDRIAKALAQRFDRPHWRVEIDAGYCHDQRLVGGEDRMPPLSGRLG